MRGGNNKKPTQLKIVQGTFRKDRSSAHEPEIPPVLEPPRPPSWLSKEAKREWRRLAKLLTESGILTELDLTALEITCSAYGMYRESLASIYRPVDPATGKRRNRTLSEYLDGRNAHTCPELTVMRQAFAQYRALLSEFGLAPQSRSRLDIPRQHDDDVDPMEALLNER